MVATSGGELTAIFPVGNGAEPDIEISRPYTVQVTIQGNAAILLHRYDPDAVEEKIKSKKGSKAKKTDNLESYVYRTDDGDIGIPGTYICGAIYNAAKNQQDPRSPRKQAVDLFKAGVVSLTDVAPILTQGRTEGVKTWEYEDRRRAPLQRVAITRVRPAFRPGWRVTHLLRVILPEYISSDFLLQVIVDAGRFVGIADYRPTFGRFQVVNYEVLADDVTVG